MATAKRQQDSALRHRLFREFYRFPFIQAVHLLERFFPNKKKLGGTLVPGDADLAADDVVEIRPVISGGA